MLDTTFTEQYVREIPWEKKPAFAFNDDAAKYLEAFQNVIQVVPGTDKKIKFADEYWDFRPYYEDINDDSYVIRFSRAGEDYVDYLKFYTIYAIGRKTKISSAGRRIGDFITVISAVKSSTNHKSFGIITTDDIIDAIEDRDVTNSRYHSLYAAMHLIYDFILKNYKLDLPVDVSILKEKSAHFKKRSKEEDDKTPNIPEDYYTIIVDKAIEVLNEDNQSLNCRMTAGLIIIASQTGLRIQDLLGIKTDDLIEKELPKSGVKCHYLQSQALCKAKS